MTYIKDHILNNDCCGLILAFWQYVFGGMLSLLIGRVERNSNPKVVTVKARIFSDPPEIKDSIIVSPQWSRSQLSWRDRQTAVFQSGL